MTGPAEAATYRNILNNNSGHCLSVEGGGSTSDGANAIQWTCNGGAEQYWTFRDAIIEA
ncbi:RICIN domain-containing protein [Amycolatopsis sp. NPDC058278]|uniref:RICIN domain-containing protein n=1 Tax=Amycolatopsis sp. NPDC058278 TaxID=3346417 RepID=UPI0036D80910